MNTGSATPPWLVRRLFPALAAIVMAAAGMAGTIWGPRSYGKSAWALPEDLWGTLIGAQRIIHLNLGGLYTPPTQLVSLPGAAIILIPVVAIMGATGIALHAPGTLGPHPASWLLIGPYEVLISAVALFAADAIAERLGASRPKRFLLAAASATALWSVTVRWGHPEDAVATGLLLYAVLDQYDASAPAPSDTHGAGSRFRATMSRAAWLAGAAVAVQPLVLLALPVMMTVVAPRRWPGFLTRAAAPSVVLLAISVAANWTATIHAVTSQPNSPVIDHPTPWIYLAPHLAAGQVAAGPARIAAIVAACGCGLIAKRQWPRPDQAQVPRPDQAQVPRPDQAQVPRAAWRPELLAELLWWVAVALALRSVFEPVMVAYYLWPPLAVAMIAAARDWSRLFPTCLAATGLTFLAQIWWRNPWAWWLPMTAVLGLTLFLARMPRGRTPLVTAAQVFPEPGEQFVPDGAP